MKTFSLLFIVAAAVAVAYPVATSAQAAWYPIDVDEPHVQELGGWAVAEHVKQAHDGLKFSKVRSGEEQSDAGVKYHLVIEALDGDSKQRRYEAFLVEEVRGNTRTLISFRTVLDAAAPPSAAPDGKWQPITNITDPHVQDLGEWAVAAHNKVYNDGLRFSKVVGGEVQIVAGVNYRLEVDALRLNGKDAMYKAEVFEQDWPTIATRKLISFDPAN